MPLTELADALRPAAMRTDVEAAYESTETGELTEVAQRIAEDPVARLAVLLDLGLGYLTLSAARRRCRRASCSGCGSRRRCARTCSASSTCSTSRRRACIRPTPRRCSTRSIG